MVDLIDARTRPGDVSPGSAHRTDGQPAADDSLGRIRTRIDAAGVLASSICISNFIGGTAEFHPRGAKSPRKEPAMFLIVVLFVAAVVCAAGYRAFVGRRRVTRAEYVALRRAEDASAWEAAQDRIAARRAE